MSMLLRDRECQSPNPDVVEAETGRTVAVIHAAATLRPKRHGLTTEGHGL
jgi:hypothetical protein